MADIIISGTNRLPNLATLLLGGVFNLFAASSSGVEFSLIAVQSSS